MLKVLPQQPDGVSTTQATAGSSSRTDQILRDGTRDPADDRPASCRGHAGLESLGLVPSPTPGRQVVALAAAISSAASLDGRSSVVNVILLCIGDDHAGWL